MNLILNVPMNKIMMKINLVMEMNQIIMKLKGQKMMTMRKLNMTIILKILSDTNARNALKFLKLNRFVNFML